MTVIDGVHLRNNPMQRRNFLADCGLGFTGLAMGSMLAADGIVRADSKPTGEAHFPPRAKSIVWVFLSGGYSQMETFDPKPMLNKYAGKTFSETPFPNPVDSPLHRERFRSAPAEEINIRDVYTKIFPMQVGFAHHGESGIAVSDWWPHLAKQVDDICFVRNMWTTDNDHAAENQIHTGRHKLDETQPSIGAWAHYGLGSLNENLPRFVVLGGPTRTDTRQSIDSYYLGPAHAGVPLKLDPKNPLSFGTRRTGQTALQQANEFDLISRLNRITAEDRPTTRVWRRGSNRTNWPFGCRRRFPRRWHWPRKPPTRRKCTELTRGRRSWPASDYWRHGGWWNEESALCRCSPRPMARGTRTRN